MKSIYYFGLMALLILAACDRSGKQDLALPAERPRQDEIVVTVGETEITASQVLEAMRYRGGHIPDRYASAQDRESLLNEMIHFEVLAQKAVEAGVDQNPQFVAAYKKMLVAKFQQDWLEKQIRRQHVADAQVRIYYNRHLSDFSSPSMIRIALIRIGYHTGDNAKIRTGKRQTMRQVREEAIRQAHRRRDFGKLARKYSDDEKSKYRGGAINWISKASKIHEWDPKTIEAVFRLKRPGEISPVIETEEGLLLAKLMGLRPSKVQPFAAVKDRIRRTLEAEKRKKWMERYYEKARKELAIAIRHDRLEALVNAQRLSDAGGEPPVLPAD